MNHLEEEHSSKSADEITVTTKAKKESRDLVKMAFSDMHAAGHAGMLAASQSALLYVKVKMTIISSRITVNFILFLTLLFCKGFNFVLPPRS